DYSPYLEFPPLTCRTGFTGGCRGVFLSYQQLICDARRALCLYLPRYRLVAALRTLDRRSTAPGTAGVLFKAPYGRRL
ncbi:hypothetical protein, partial [Halomonas colorata]|uniref:hypothetical protein n=1 Tax=Halomonas colorata TaxID=2742615 RepID=UPI001CE41181